MAEVTEFSREYAKEGEKLGGNCADATAPRMAKWLRGRDLNPRLSPHSDGQLAPCPSALCLPRGDTPEHYNIFRWRIFVKSGRQVLDPAMEAAGITRVSRGHGFHIFRHSAASILYD